MSTFLKIFKRSDSSEVEQNNVLFIQNEFDLYH